MTINPRSMYTLSSGDFEGMNDWLAKVRACAPLAQPTAYRLALLLTAQERGSLIRLTEPEIEALGPDTKAWNDDLDRLYRQGLIAMWCHIPGPSLVMLLNIRDEPRCTEAAPA